MQDNITLTDQHTVARLFSSKYFEMDLYQVQMKDTYPFNPKELFF